MMLMIAVPTSKYGKVVGSKHIVALVDGEAANETICGKPLYRFQLFSSHSEPPEKVQAAKDCAHCRFRLLNAATAVGWKVGK